MPETATRSQVFLARLVLGLGAVLAAFGLLRYGLSANVQGRLWQDVFERPGGPMSFRFVLQPVLAALAAWHDGWKDARQGHGSFLARLLSNPDERGELMWEALLATARIMLVGFAMDAIYQFTVLKSFFPGEMLVIVLALAFVPYLLLRSPFSRLARWWLTRDAAGPV